MGRYRPGFFREARAIVRIARSRLGLALTEPMDPRALAALMDIAVLPLSALHEVSEAAIRLLRTHPSAFSAVTVVRGNRRAAMIAMSFFP